MNTLQNVIKGSTNTLLCLFLPGSALKFSLCAVLLDIFATFNICMFYLDIFRQKTVIVLLVAMEIRLTSHKKLQQKHIVANTVLYILFHFIVLCSGSKFNICLWFKNVCLYCAYKYSIRDKLTKGFSPQRAGWHPSPQGQWHDGARSAFSFFLCTFWCLLGRSLISLLGHMKNRLGLLVPAEVALILHHLRNDGACSVYRKRSNLGSSAPNYQWRRNA